MSSSEEFKEELVRVRTAAKILGISVKTLYLWIRKGIIKAYVLPTGKYRIPVSEIKRVLREVKAK